MITLPARPESLSFAPQQSALIVVDMQNAYASGAVIWISPALTSPLPGRLSTILILPSPLRRGYVDYLVPEWLG